MENYGDFCGFTFNGVTSLSLGILRVSDGSRYTQNLSPNFQDKTLSMEGRDSVYYIDTNYSQRVFTIPFVFDCLSENGVQNLARTFNPKVTGKLIFNENPYKSYTVKVQSPIQLKTVCFDDIINGAISRVYRGEGSISFVAYDPFARSVHKWLSDYTDGNKDEWKDASRMKATQGTYDGTNSNNITLWNAGDLPTDWTAYYAFTDTTCALSQIQIASVGQLQFNTFTKQGNDTHIGINSRTHLIEGYTNSGNVYTKTGNLYNSYITAGDFFKIPLDESHFVSTGANCATIKYDYLYY